MKFYFLRMKSDEVGTTLKHPGIINGNVKNLSKRMEMEDKENVTLASYFLAFLGVFLLGNVLFFARNAKETCFFPWGCVSLGKETCFHGGRKRISLAYQKHFLAFPTGKLGWDPRFLQLSAIYIYSK